LGPPLNGYTKFVGATGWLKSMTLEFAEIEMVRKIHPTLLNDAELSTCRGVRIAQPPSCFYSHFNIM